MQKRKLGEAVLSGPPGPIGMQAAVFCLAYFVLAQIGDLLSFKPNPFVNVWLPGGLYVATLLCREGRTWPWFVAAAFAGNIAFDLTHGRSWDTALLFSCGNSLEAVAGAWLVRRFVGKSPPLANLREMLAFVGLAALASPILSASLGAGVATAWGEKAAYGSTWLLWWSSDALGILLVGSLILAWAPGAPSLWPSAGSRVSGVQTARLAGAWIVRHGWRLIEAALLILGIALCAWLVLEREEYGQLPRKYLLMPFMVWAGLRFGLRGASLAALTLSFLAVYLTGQDRGSFPPNIPMTEQMIILQMFLAVSALMGLIPAAVVAERKALEIQARQGEERLRSLYDSMTELVVAHEVVRDPSGRAVDYRILDCNPAFSRITGITLEQAAGRLATQVYGTAEAPYLEVYARVAETGEPARFDTYYAPMDKYFSISVFSPGPGRFATVAGDISERKHYEHELERLNRLYAVLSAVNQSVIKAESREVVFQKVCRAAVEQGRFKLAWIGWLDPETRAVRPVAQCGDVSDLLARVGFNLDAPADGWCPIAQAMREEKHVVCNDFAEAQNTAPCHQMARQQGYQSCAAFPLRMGGRVCGVLGLYACEAGFFRDKEILLLDEAASDTSFALEHLESEAKRKQAEELLAQSEAHFRLLYQEAPVAYQSLDAEGCFLEVNASWLEIMGYQREEVIGRWFGDFLAGEGCDLFRQRFPRFKEAGETHGVEFDLERKDGRVVTVAFEGRIGYDGNHLFRQTHCVMRDITAQKKAENALRLSEARLKDSQRVARIGHYNFATDRGVWTNSETLDAIFGIGPEYPRTVEGWARIVHPEQREAMAAYFAQEVLEQRHPFDREYRIQRVSDGRECWVHGLGKLKMGADGRVVEMFGTIQDITERKRAEMELRASEERFRRAMVNAPIPIAIHTEDGKFLQVNQSWCDLSGYAPEELITMADWTERVYGDRKMEVQAGIDRLFTLDHRVAEGDFQIRTKSGATRIWDFSSAPLGRLPDGRRLVISMATDVTERRATEEALRLSLEEKTVLLKEVHHRVKNNLQIISSLLNLQAARIQDAQIAAALQQTRNRVHAMALLHESLYRSENLARVNFPGYVEDLCAHLARSFGPELAARIKLDCRIAPALLDLDQTVPCGLMINELVFNALKYAFPGQRAGRIRVEFQVEAGQARLIVADDGIGLPPELEVSQTKSLGLRLVTLLAGQLLGAVEIRRAAGTSFQITFSLRTEKSHPA